jgi:hypothetical protein
MPANFGEIAGFHSRMATRYLTLAKAARDRGDLTTANYHADQAARYLEAAQEQKLAMSHAPGRSAADQKPRQWSPKPKSVPLATAGWLAVLRGAGHMASALRQSISKRGAPFHGLTLH